MLNIFIVLIITISLRLFLAYETSDSLLHTLDGEFLSILTPDASLYGYYAKLLLADLPHNSDVYLIEYVIYFLVKITPFSLDQILYFLPAFLSSLVVIPTMLLSKLFINSKQAIISIGLIVGVGYGYYSRTYLGYCDTDMLNLFFPMLILYGMVISIRKNSYQYALVVVSANILYLSWYHASLPLVYAMNGLFIVYGLVFHFKHTQIYKISILLAISIIKIALVYKLVILSILFVGFRYIKLDYRYFLSSFVAVFLVAIYKIDISQFLFHANRYIFKSQTFNTNGFDFVSPMQFVAEAGNQSVFAMAHLISGNIILFTLSIFGYILLVSRHKEMLLALPMLVLGLLSMEAGVRFHIYAVGVMSISYIYLVYYLTLKFRMKKLLASLTLSIMFMPTIYQNYQSLNYWNTKVAMPVFYPEQVKILQELEKLKSKNAYAVTWWDYGWPVRYYSGLNTMIDNGRHHADNFTVANILISPSQKFSHHAINYFYNTFAKDNNNDAILQALQKEKSIKKLFQQITSNQLNPKEKVEKYIILPMQMTKLVYTIFTYANIDPQTGKKISSHIFRSYSKIKENTNYIYFNKNTILDKRKSILVKGKNKILIKRFTQIAFRGNKKMKRVANISNVGLNLVKFANRYYVMDDYFYNSTLVQLMLFNNYDKKYFEPIYEGQTIAVYKVK